MVNKTTKVKKPRSVSKKATEITEEISDTQGLLSKIGNFFSKPNKKLATPKAIKSPYRYKSVLGQFHSNFESLKKIRDTVANFTREVHSSAIPNDAMLLSFAAIGEERPGENLGQRIAPFVTGLRQKGLYSLVDLDAKVQAPIHRFWLSIEHIIPSLINPRELINMLLTQGLTSAGDTILAPSVIEEVWGRRLRIQIYCPTSISILLVRPDKIFGSGDSIVTLDQHLTSRQTGNQLNHSGYFLLEFEIPCEKGSILIAGTSVQEKTRLSRHIISVRTK